MLKLLDNTHSVLCVCQGCPALLVPLLPSTATTTTQAASQPAQPPNSNQLTVLSRVQTNTSDSERLDERLLVVQRLQQVTGSQQTDRASWLQDSHCLMRTHSSHASTRTAMLPASRRHSRSTSTNAPQAAAAQVAVLAAPRHPSCEVHTSVPS